MLDTGTKEYWPVQDGVKAPFCCWQCEQTLGRSEQQFRERFFRPYIAGRTSNLKYGTWLSRFAAANVWRVLQYHLEDTRHFRGRRHCAFEASARQNSGVGFFGVTPLVWDRTAFISSNSLPIMRRRST